MREGLLEKSLPRREKGEELSDDDVEDAIVVSCCSRISVIWIER